MWEELLDNHGGSQLVQLPSEFDSFQDTFLRFSRQADYNRRNGLNSNREGLLDHLNAVSHSVGLTDYR